MDYRIVKVTRFTVYQYTYRIVIILKVTENTTQGLKLGEGEKRVFSFHTVTKAQLLDPGWA